MTETTLQRATTPRIRYLDVLRGFAVCGILLVNVPPLWHMNAYPEVGGPPLPVREFLDLFVQGRFFPLFSLLFGIGFGLMWASARRRAARPRVVMLRRFALLGVLGIAHQLLQPGEALLPYAIVAVALLLPATFLPERAQLPVAAAVGGVLTVVAALAGGSLLLVPGLFLLGFAAARAGLPRAIEERPIAVAIALVPTAIAAVAALQWQRAEAQAMSGEALVPAIAGLLVAACYALAIGLLLRTPLGRPLEALFAPLGRMALTNYLSATLLIIAARPLVGPLGLDQPTEGAWLLMLAFCALVIIAQRLVSGLWLRRYAQGPLERLWRRVTWWDWRATGAAVGTSPSRSASSSSVASRS